MQRRVGFIIIPILQRKKPTLGKCQSRELNPGSLSPEPRLGGSGQSFPGRGPAEAHGGQGTGCPEERWTSHVNLKQTEPRPGEFGKEVGSRTRMAPLVWFEGLELTSNIKEPEINVLKIKTDRTRVIQLLPCKPLGGCSSERQRVR